jgi:hypothetical protein
MSYQTIAGITEEIEKVQNIKKALSNKVETLENIVRKIPKYFRNNREEFLSMPPYSYLGNIWLGQGVGQTILMFIYQKPAQVAAAGVTAIMWYGLTLAAYTYRRRHPKNSYSKW